MVAFLGGQAGISGSDGGSTTEDLGLGSAGGRTVWGRGCEATGMGGCEAGWACGCGCGVTNLWDGARGLPRFVSMCAETLGWYGGMDGIHACVVDVIFPYWGCKVDRNGPSHSHTHSLYVHGGIKKITPLRL